MSRHRSPRWNSPPASLRDRWSITLPPQSAEVEAVELHDVDPRGDEVANELLARVVGAVDLGDGPQLRVGAEHEVGRRRGPSDGTGRPVAALVHVLLRRRR